MKGAVTVAVGLTYRDTPDRIEWFSAMPTESTNGWRAYRAQLPTRGGHSRRIARVSLRLAGTGRLGRFTLVDTTTSARKPAGVGGFAARNVGATPGTDGLTNVAFTWTASRDAWYYDVYQLGRSAHSGVSNAKAPQEGWLGRAHRDALFADHVDLTHGAQFGIVPFTQDGTAGRLTAVRIA